MVRDSVTNLVVRLQDCGFDPRKIGDNAWEARCPAHGSSDYALSITRGERGHVSLECRGSQRCPYIQIIAALGFTNDDAYAETPEWMIERVEQAAIHPASFESAVRMCPQTRPRSFWRMLRSILDCRFWISDRIRTWPRSFWRTLRPKVARLVMRSAANVWVMAPRVWPLRTVGRARGPSRTAATWTVPRRT